MNGSGIPVRGASPSTAARLITACPPTSPTIPAASRLPNGSVHAGVFPEIASGDYTLLGIGGRASCDLTVTAGRVTEVRW